MITIAIDPGRKPGFAIERDGELRATTNLEMIRAWGLPHSGESVQGILEIPTIYPGGKSRPNDLIQLALTAGSLAAMIVPSVFEVRTVQPRTWKGSLAKSMHHARVLPHVITRWGDAAGQLFIRGTDDTRDAIALLLWRLGPEYSPALTRSLW